MVIKEKKIVKRQKYCLKDNFVKSKKRVKIKSFNIPIQDIELSCGTVSNDSNQEFETKS